MFGSKCMYKTKQAGARVNPLPLFSIQDTYLITQELKVDIINYIYYSYKCREIEAENFHKIIKMYKSK